MEKSKRITLDLNMEEVQHIPSVLTTLFVEFVSLLLFQRSQIPATIQMLKKSAQAENRSNEAETSYRSKTRVHTRKSKFMKGCKEIVESLDELPSHLAQVLNHCQDFQAAVVFGSTPATTKEAYLFHANCCLDHKTPCRTPTSTVMQQYTRQLGLKMIQHDFSQLKENGITKMRIFVRAGRNLASDVFVPWENWRFPSKKQVLEMSVNVAQPEIISPPIIQERIRISKKRKSLDAEESLEQILKRASLDGCPGNDKQKTDCDVTPKHCDLIPKHCDVTVELSSRQSDDDEIIWFLLPTCLKGVKC